MKRARLVPVLCVLALIGLTTASFGGGLEDEVDGEVTSLFEIFKYLHANPELSYQEDDTAKYVAEELRRLGFEVTEGVGDYGVEGRTSCGVVAVMRNGDGPTVMVRTDLDGLPVEEESGLPYASVAKGLADDGSEVFAMHACGHDLHMTSWLGTARMLSQMKDSWSGTLVFIGQPAEERGAGAQAMLEDGLFERFPKARLRPGVAQQRLVARWFRRSRGGLCARRCRFGRHPGAGPRAVMAPGRTPPRTQ